MFLQLFVPPVVAGRRIYGEKILLLSFDAGMVQAMVLHKGRIWFTLTDFVSQPYQTTLIGKKYFPEKESLQQAVQALLAQMPKCDALYVGIPSNFCVFKNLNIPLLEVEQIDLVLDFEIEALLPFAIQESCSSFVLLSQTKEESKLLVCATRQQEVTKYVQSLTSQSMAPANIYADVILAYNGILSSAKGVKRTQIFVIYDTHHINLGYIIDDQLVNVRNFEFGLDDFCEILANKDEQKMPLEQFKQTLAKKGLGGLEAPGLTDEFKVAFQPLFFALDSLMLQQAPDGVLDQIVIFNFGPAVKDLAPFSQSLFGYPCLMFDYARWLSQVGVSCKQKKPESLASFGRALLMADLNEKVAHFNLGSKLFALAAKSLFVRQMILLVSLLGCLFSYLIFSGVRQLNHLQQVEHKLEQDLLKNLQQNLPKKIKVNPKTRPAKLISDFAQVVEKQEASGVLAASHTPDILACLLVLTRNIDNKTRFSVKVESLTLKMRNAQEYSFVLTGDFKPLLDNEDFSDLVKTLQASSRLVILDSSVQDDLGTNMKKFTLELGVKDVQNN